MSSCLERFLCYPNICYVPVQILNYRELNVVTPISSLALNKILISVSWITMLILILKSTNSQGFQDKTISGIFVELSKKLPYFCPLEVILK